MKKVMSLTSALLFVGSVGIALAQADTSTPAASTATPAQAKGRASHPLVNDIRARIEAQNERIQAGVKDKKLTKDQAAAIHTKIKVVREELQSDLKANGTRELTADQNSILNQELDGVSKDIKDKTTPAAPATPAAQ
jgi:small-conductance mechanosensitive channel